MIKTGAELVTSADDVLSLIAPLGTIKGEQIDDERREWDQLSREEQLVYEALPRRHAISIDALFALLTSELTIPAVLGALVGLGQQGLVREGLDGTWKRARSLRGADA